MKQNELINQLQRIVGKSKVITNSMQTAYYRSGFRSGKGQALAVVFPNSLLQEWRLIEACVKAECIIIMQAANQVGSSINTFIMVHYKCRVKYI